MMIKTTTTNTTIATITPTMELLLSSDCEDESVGELMINVGLVLVGAVITLLLPPLLLLRILRTTELVTIVVMGISVEVLVTVKLVL